MSKLSTISRNVVVSTVIVAGAFVAGRATADQPMMHAALESLRSAEHSLAAAEEDKGGHRARALKLTRAAISEVEKGIVYDRRH